MSLRVSFCGRPEHRSVEHIVAGFKRHGINVHVSGKLSPCDLAIVWGYQNGHPPGHYRRLLVFERGYMKRRRLWPSVGYDGLNGFADFCNANVPADRWDRVFADSMQPWRSPMNDQGSYVLIIGQVPGDANLRGLDIHKWCFKTAKALTAAGHEVAIKWHPKSPARPACPYPVLDADVRMDEALMDARYIVTYNSNSAVDAVLAGVPAVTIDKGSMAYEVTGHDPLVMPPTPDRTVWAQRMAYTQWCMDGRGDSINEIANGDFWDHLKQGMT